MKKVVGYVILLGGLMVWGTQLRAMQSPANLAGVPLARFGPLPSLDGVAAVDMFGTNAITVDATGHVKLWSTQSAPPAMLMPPAGLSNVVDVAIGGAFAAALMADGTVACWGEIDPAPVFPTGSKVVQLAAGANHLLALTGSGKVFAWGSNDVGQASVPGGLSNVVQVVAGPNHSFALQANGMVFGWGENANGQLNVPPDETNNVAVATGAWQTLLLRQNGTIAGLGANRGGVLNIPVGLNGIIAVAACRSHSFALDSSGSIFHWGMAMAPGPDNVDTVFGRDSFAYAWVKNPVLGTIPDDILASPGETIGLSIPVYGKAPLHCQWMRNGAAIPGATQPTLTLTNLQAGNVGEYALTVSNAFGGVTSAQIAVRIGRPEIYAQPLSTVASPGSRVSLEVGATGLEPLSYTWLLNGTAIEGATEHTLVFSNVQYSASGEYRVVISNSLGSITSAIAKLQIAEIDQQQSASDSWIELARGPVRGFLAQTFTPSVSGRLVQVSIGAACNGVEFEWPTSFSIVDTVAGRPGTNLLGRTVISHLADSGSILFEEPLVYLEAGTEYAVVITTDDPTDARTYEFMAMRGNPYTAGRVWERIGEGPWLEPQSPSSDCDLAFVIRMAPGIPPVRITQPNQHVPVLAGETVPVAAMVSDTVAPPYTLAVYSGGALLAQSTNSPLQLNWTPASPGIVDLAATLTSSSGTIVTSAIVQVTVIDSAPANDRFANRTRLTGEYSVVGATNLNATRDLGEGPIGNGPGSTVWWQWTAPRSGEVTVGIEQPQQTNAIIGVFAGTTVDALLPITNGIGLCSFSATTGATYQVALDSISGAISNGTLVLAINDVEFSSPATGAVFHAPASVVIGADRVSTQRVLVSIETEANGLPVGSIQTNALTGVATISTPGYYSLRLASTDSRGWVTRSSPLPITVRPGNDDFETAEIISGRRISIHTSNTAATMQVGGGGTPWDPKPKTGEPTWCDNQGGHSIWYQWTAPNDGFCLIHGAGTNFALLFDVCLGSSVNTLSVVAGNALAPANSGVAFDAIAGTTYFISADGFTGEEGALDWTLDLQPYNDDFARRRQLTGMSAEFFQSNAGATLESTESSYAPEGAGSSVWFTWQAPFDGDVTINLSGTNGLSVAVYRGNSIETLAPLAVSAGSWSNSTAVRFTAQAGLDYHIAVFGQGASEGNFLFEFALQGLRWVSPLPNSILAFPAHIELEAQLNLPGKSLVEVIYSVNGLEFGSVTNAPFKLNWIAPGPATYTLSARGIASDGTTFESCPVTCLVYSGKQMPRPRVFSGVQSSASYVINSVGALSLFGGNPQQFGRTSAHSLSTPFLASWPAGVTGWKEISGDFAVSDSGELYQNGQVLIPFPAGVTRWKKVSRGFEGVITIGDDDHLYWGGTDRIDVAEPAGGWREIAASLAGVNFTALTLGADGEAYLLTHSDKWYASLLARPAGVVAWRSIASAGLFGVLLTDNGELYIYGMYGGVTGTSGTPGWSYVPRPAGVNRWVDFAAGGYHVLAIGDNAQLYAWGRNWEHQLGTGEDQNALATPALVILPPGVTGWSAVAAGQYHSLAIGQDCSVYAWGQNNVGQVGQPSSTPLARPIRVSSLEALCGTPVLFADGKTSQLEDGSFRIQFNSDLNRSYLIQYSDDFITWKNATPSVIGTGGLAEWIDDGPPKTDRHPRSVSRRIYRVVYAP